MSGPSNRVDDGLKALLGGIIPTNTGEHVRSKENFREQEGHHT